MEIRTLEPGERDAVLQLLDRWEMPDGWRGYDFFARYMECDPSFSEENFWVAEEGGRLVSCVQIFPRPLRLSEGVVPLGGIGSVFTDPEHRSGGRARAVIARAEEAMRERGMALGLLFTERITFYAQFGWCPGPSRTPCTSAKEIRPPAPRRPNRRRSSCSISAVAGSSCRCA